MKWPEYASLQIRVEGWAAAWTQVFPMFLHKSEENRNPYNQNDKTKKMKPRR